MNPSGHSVGKINSNILALTLPAILSNITVPLLGLSDTFISGHLGAEKYISAIAVGTTMVNTLYWLLGFLRTGTTGLTAEAYGRNDSAGRQRILTASFLLAMLLGLLIILIRPLLSRGMLMIMGPSEEVAALGNEYFAISILAAPALLATMSVVGWMIGMQNTLYPMIIAIVVNVINIALSFTLVYGLETGFIGVAIGTAAANWCGLLLAILLGRRLAGDSPMWSSLKSLKGELDLRRFFRVNSDLMIRSACIMGVLFGMTSLAGRIGDHALAINVILMQFFMFFSYFMDGFAFSAEALCGRFAGAGDRTGINLTLRVLGVWSLAMVGLFTTIYAMASTSITSLLTDVESVVESVGELKWILCVLPAISAAAFIFDGVYIGMTATRRLLIATFIAMTAFFLIADAGEIVSRIFSMTGETLQGPILILTCSPLDLLWTGFLIFLLLRGVLLAGMLPRVLQGVKRHS